jgi:hypothetical protein
MRDIDVIAGATSTLRRRLFDRIIGRGKDVCWIWTGGFARKRRSRRPKVQVGGRGSRTISVARVILALRDRVPLIERDRDKLEAGHTCHNEECVNWWHLDWQTREENECAKRDRDAFERFTDEFDRIIAEETTTMSPKKVTKKAAPKKTTKPARPARKAAPKKTQPRRRDRAPKPVADPVSDPSPAPVAEPLPPVSPADRDAVLRHFAVPAKAARAVSTRGGVDWRAAGRRAWETRQARAAAARVA